MAKLECDMDFLGNEENKDEDVSLLRAGILEHSPKKSNSRGSDGPKEQNHFRVIIGNEWHDIFSKILETCYK